MPLWSMACRFDLARNRVGDRGALNLAKALPECDLEAVRSALWFSLEFRGKQVDEI